MIKKVHFCLITFSVAFVLFSTMVQAAPGGNKWPVPATVESSSAVYEDIADSGSDYQLEINSYPEIRHISITVMVNFSTFDTIQRVEILAPMAGGSFQVKRFSADDGMQQLDTIEFNADGWTLRAYNAPGGDEEGFSFDVDYMATTIY